MSPTFDDNELARIAQTAYGPLLLFARQWDENLAEDAVQTAILKLCRNYYENGRPDNVVAWLFQVVRNELRYRTRQRKTVEKHAERYAGTQPPWFLPKQETRIDAEAVAAELKNLPLENREVIVAKIWGDLSFDEIAELLEISRSTAHRRYVDGLEQLRNRVKR